MHHDKDRHTIYFPIGCCIQLYWRHLVKKEQNLQRSRQNNLVSNNLIPYFPLILLQQAKTFKQFCELLQHLFKNIAHCDLNSYQNINKCIYFSQSF